MDSNLGVKPKKFFAYCRESIDLDSGVQIQKEAIVNYSKLNNIEIAKWYIDNDASAYFFRPHYDEMMKIILDSSCEIEGIICNALSRFGRSTIEVLTAKEELKNFNKELVLVKENMDTTTSHGKLIFGILVLFNDFEHDLILERTRAGTNYAKIHGTKSGKPMHRPPKKVDWKKFDELSDKKVSIPSIAKILGMTKKTLYTKIKEREKK